MVENMIRRTVSNLLELAGVGFVLYAGWALFVPLGMFLTGFVLFIAAQSISQEESDD